MYLETSAAGCFVEPAESVRGEAVRRLVGRAEEGLIQLAVSGLVFEEVEQAPGPIRLPLLQVLRSTFITLLPETPEVKEVAEEYLAAKVVPSAERSDATHVAFASVHGWGFIASYNLRHLVRRATIARANRINRRRGLGAVDIRTPELIP